MKIYSVGGAVRDQLLGLPVQDRDHVVVGATPEQMLTLGFTPVGKDFPVFLHPKTHEEYALARTERKTAPGYRGFVFHTDQAVTLEQDLIRRDLTINAMALGDDGLLVDPFGGQRDLRGKIFRHVSSAFAEDPVRILRLARFAARFTDFSVAPETHVLMRQMVAAGEVDALVPERVWQELARGLNSKQPSRMIAVLRDCGALARLLPELNALYDRKSDAGAHAMSMIDDCAREGWSLPIRFAALLHGLGSPPLIEAVCKRLNVPGDCRDLAVMAAREHGSIGQAPDLCADDLVKIIERCDALRKPQRFRDMLLVENCDFRARSGVAGGDGDSCEPPFAPMEHLLRALAASQGVPAGEIALACGERPQEIPAAIHAARVEAVRAVL